MKRGLYHTPFIANVCFGSLSPYTLVICRRVLTGIFTPETNEQLRTAVDAYTDGDTTTYGHISEWNTSLITDMSTIFLNKNNFNQDISEWDVSSVTDMSWMFYGASSFNQQLCWFIRNNPNREDMFSGSGGISS